MLPPEGGTTKLFLSHLLDPPPEMDSIQFDKTMLSTSLRKLAFVFSKV
jgi:hypothetical protein